MGNEAEVSIVVRVRNAAVAGLNAIRTQFKEFGAGMKQGLNQAGFQTWGQAFGAVAGKVKHQIKELASEFKGLGEFFTLAGMVGAIHEAVKASQELDASLRRLKGAAELVGAPLEYVKTLSAETAEKFKIDDSEANKWVAEVITLAAKTNDLGQAQDALNDFLQLGAAQGLNVEESFSLMQQAADGNERSLRQLFNRKPAELFKEYAASIGKSADALTETDKAQAILTAAHEKALLVGTPYFDMLNASEGAGRRASVQVQQLSEDIGTKLKPAFVVVSDAIITFTHWVRQGVADIESFAAVLQGLWSTVTVLVPAIARVGLDISGGNFIQAAVDAQAPIQDIKNIWEGVAAAIAESQAAVDNYGKEVTKVNETGLEELNKRLRLQHEVTALAEESNKLLQGESVTTKDIERVEGRITALLKNQNLTLHERQLLEQSLKEIAEAREKIATEMARKEAAARDARQQQQRIEAAGGGNVILPKGAGVAEQTVVPALLEGLGGIGGDRATQRANASLRQSGVQDAAKKVETFGEAMKKQLLEATTGPLADFFKAGLQGFKDLGDAVRQFGLAVADALLNIAATLAANALLNALFSGFASGGKVKARVGAAAGGPISGPGGSTGDAIPAMLSDGEYVINARSASALGVDTLNFLNSLGGHAARPGRFHFSGGGPVLTGAGAGSSIGDVNVIINAVDAKSVQDLLKANRGTLAREVLEAVRTSTAYASMLRGA